MPWLKRATPCLLVFVACAAWVSAQTGSGTGSASGGPASTTSTPSATIPDASTPPQRPKIQPGVGGDDNSSTSSSTPVIRDDPYSPFDTSEKGLNLRRVQPDDPPAPPTSVMSLDTINEEDCGTWTQVGVHSATVSMVRLEVPGKARGVYQKACNELKKKKLEAAEHEAKKAVDAYHNYPAAWVLLGQAFYNGNDMDHAQNACTQASKIDPGYVAPYLCLAAVADHDRDWDEAQTLSDEALALSPLKNAYALYYKAEAAYHKGQLREAERNALDAAGADTNHELPQIELLLARIYTAMKNESEAAVRVRNYLRFAHEPSNAAAVHSQLAAISDGQ